MTEARAVWFTGPRAVALRPEPVPEPGPGELLVRAIASGISAGTELLVYRGQVEPDLPLDLPTLRGSFGFPIKYGYATVARVEAAGRGVTRAEVGDLVFCLHPHQDRFVVPQAVATRLPADLAPELGVFMANLTTAITVVLDARTALADVAVVFGLGTIGQLVAQLLRRGGAELVVGVDPLAGRRDLGRRLGAHLTLPPGEELATALTRETGGRGADVAVEVSGAPAALQQAIDVVADEGTVVVASWYGTKPVSLRLGERFHRGRVRLRSSQVGRLDPALGPRWDRARRDEVACRLLSELRLAPLISHRLPFERAAEAYGLLDQQPDVGPQIVLTYD